MNCAKIALSVKWRYSPIALCVTLQKEKPAPTFIHFPERLFLPFARSPYVIALQGGHINIRITGLRAPTEKKRVELQRLFDHFNFTLQETHNVPGKRYFSGVQL